MVLSCLSFVHFGNSHKNFFSYLCSMIPWLDLWDTQNFGGNVTHLQILYFLVSIKNIQYNIIDLLLLKCTVNQFLLGPMMCMIAVVDVQLVALRW